MAIKSDVIGLVDVPKEERRQVMHLLERVDAAKPTKEDTTALRDALARYPSLWRVIGDLASGVIAHTIDTMQAPLSLKESMAVGMKAMRLELGGVDPPMLERLLIDQILICWLRQADAEYRYTEVVRDAGDRKALYWEKRLTQTQKRYLRAIEALARVRRLAHVTPLQVNNWCSTGECCRWCECAGRSEGMLNTYRDPQYEQWKQRGGTAYAEQQLRYKQQWERQRDSGLPRPPSIDDEIAALEKMTRKLVRVTEQEVHSVKAQMQTRQAERKALALRDIQEDEKQIQIEMAQAKHFKAARTASNAVEGLALVYNVVDTYGTRFQPGCLKNETPKSIKYCWEHNEGEYGYTGPIARVTALYEISRAELPESVRLQYPEAKGGLVVVREYLDTENGKAARWWLMNGTKGISIGGLKILRSTTREENGRRVTDVYEAEIDEISDGRTKGMVPGTMPFTGNSQDSLLSGRFKR